MNREMPSLQGWSLEIKLTVPLTGFNLLSFCVSVKNRTKVGRVKP